VKAERERFAGDPATDTDDVELLCQLATP